MFALRELARTLVVNGIRIAMLIMYVRTTLLLLHQQSVDFPSTHVSLRTALLLLHQRPIER